MSVADERERLRAPAYHEAGHAVAAHMQGYRLRAVSIVATQGRLGYCRLASPGLETLLERAPRGRGLTPTHAVHLHALVVISLSGSAALRLAGLSVGSESDDVTARRLIQRLLGVNLGEQESGDRLLARLTGEAETLLRTHWNAVERVAEALLWFRALSGQRVHDLVDSVAESRPASS